VTIRAGCSRAQSRAESPSSRRLRPNQSCDRLGNGIGNLEALQEKPGLPLAMNFGSVFGDRAVKQITGSALW